MKRNVWVGIFKVGVTIGCIWLISEKLGSRLLEVRSFDFPPSIVWVLILTFLLMVLNWYLEVVRWNYSLQSFSSSTMQKSWVDVLGGLAMNWVLPFATGDLLARVAGKEDRHQAVAALFLNRVIMLILTLGIGIYGMSYYGASISLSIWWVPFLMASLLLAYIFRKRLQKVAVYFHELTCVDVYRISVLSIARYVVFTIQLFILLRFFVPMLSDTILLAGVGWVFFFRSFIPSMFGGIGVREASGVIFFESLVQDLSMVVLPLFIIWIINTVIPSLAGAILIWKLRFIIAR